MQADPINEPVRAVQLHEAGLTQDPVGKIVELRAPADWELDYLQVMAKVRQYGKQQLNGEWSLSVASYPLICGVMINEKQPRTGPHCTRWVHIHELADVPATFADRANAYWTPVSYPEALVTAVELIKAIEGATVHE